MRAPRPFAGIGLLFPFFVACGSAPVKRAPADLLPAPTIVGKTIGERYRAGVEARLRSGLGFGYIAAIREDGKTTVVVSGRRTLEPVRALGERDLLEIGSVSKAFTGILVHLADLEGKLGGDPGTGLERRLDVFFPELRGKDAGAITVRELGLHQSGLPPYPEGVAAKDPDDPWRGMKRDEVMASLAKFRRPGLPEGKTAYERAYSNWGYLVLGILLEQVYRKPYRDLVAARMFAPLKMTESGVDVKTRRGRKATAKVSPGFSLSAGSLPSWEFDGFAAAAGGIESNARDMKRFLEGLALPPRGKLGEAIRASFASGIGWDSRPGVVLPLWKNGMTGANAAFLAFYPESRTGIFVATNTRVSPDELVDFAIGAAPNDRVLARATPARAVADDELARLKGKYRNPKPETDPALPLKAVEISETLGKIVVRYDFGVTRVGALAAPAAEEDAWNVVDGLVNADTLRIVRDGIRATVTTGSGRVADFELEKLPAETQQFPALEK